MDQTIDYQKIASLLDLTSLNDEDTPETITNLCKKAQSDLGHVAAICIYPSFIQHARNILDKTSIPIATVVNFPHGRSMLAQVQQEIKNAINGGANEIDVVFPYTDYLNNKKVTTSSRKSRSDYSGSPEDCFEFIKQCKASCGSTIILKVILEVGVLENIDTIYEVSLNVLNAGADFIKTSTGKIEKNATPETVCAMLDAIKAYLEIHPAKTVGIKIAGGIKTSQQAMDYLRLIQNSMGQQWITPNHIRIGASRLLDVLLNESITT